jgi:hypothetical protein
MDKDSLPFTQTSFKPSMSILENMDHDSRKSRGVHFDDGVLAQKNPSEGPVDEQGRWSSSIESDVKKSLGDNMQSNKPESDVRLEECPIIPEKMGQKVKRRICYDGMTTTKNTLNMKGSPNAHIMTSRQSSKPQTETTIPRTGEKLERNIVWRVNEDGTIDEAMPESQHPGTYPQGQETAVQPGDIFRGFTMHSLSTRRDSETSASTPDIGDGSLVAVGMTLLNERERSETYKEATDDVEHQARSTTTSAKQLDLEKSETSGGRKRKQLAICGVFMLLLIVLAAGIVGIVLGVKTFSRSSHTDASEIAPTNSDLPPEVKPGEDTSELDNNQEGNQTIYKPNTTTEEEPSTTNYVCSSAELLQLGSVLGSTKNIVTSQVQEAPICGSIVKNGFGVWYKVIGHDQVLSASTCDGTDSTFDTQISVYEGGCGKLECVASNDQYSPCGDRSQISWFAEIGAEYFLLVHGVRLSAGNFQLTLKAPYMGGNHCEDPVDMGLLLERLGSRRAFKTFDSTRNLVGKYEAVSSIGNCMDNKSANGRWYSFRSDEYSRFTVSTCSERTNFAADVSILYGHGCGALTCIDTPNTIACGGKGSVVEFLSSPSTTYYLLVHASEDPMAAEFELSVIPSDNLGGDRLVFVCPAFAPPLPIPGLPGIPGLPAPGSENIFEEPTALTCTNSTQFGYVETIIGTGGTISISTCNQYDGPISIFKGPTCDGLECVQVIHEECDSFGSTVSWNSSFQTTYFAKIHTGASLEPIARDFTMTGLAMAHPALDSCKSASVFPPLTPDGSTTTGILVEPSGEKAYPTAFNGTCGDVNYNSGARAWYLVTGTGQSLTAETCGSITNFDTQIGVFAGSCDQLVCVGGDDQFCGSQSRVEWQSTPNETYFVLIQGYGSRVGVYGLRLF